MEQSIQPLDLHRMILGEQPTLFLVEIVLRTSIMYIYALLAARFIGKRGMGQLTPFEFIIVIALGSATGDPMLYPSIGLLQGMAVITVTVVLERGLSKITQKSTFFSHQVESSPLLVIKNGRIIKKALKKANVNEEELFMMLRSKNITDLGEIEYSFLEPSGDLSIFHDKKHKNRKIRSTLPAKTENISH